MLSFTRYLSLALVDACIRFINNLAFEHNDTKMLDPLCYGIRHFRRMKFYFALINAARLNDK